MLYMGYILAVSAHLQKIYIYWVNFHGLASDVCYNEGGLYFGGEFWVKLQVDFLGLLIC